MKKEGAIRILMIVTIILVLLILINVVVNISNNLFLNKEKSYAHVFEVTKKVGQNSTIVNDEQYSIELYYKEGN